MAEIEPNDQTGQVSAGTESPAKLNVPKPKEPNPDEELAAKLAQQGEAAHQVVKASGGITPSSLR